MRLKHLDLQVSLKLKPEDKGFRFGKKVLMDGRIKVSWEEDSRRHIYILNNPLESLKVQEEVGLLLA